MIRDSTDVSNSVYGTDEDALIIQCPSEHNNELNPELEHQLDCSPRFVGCIQNWRTTRLEPSVWMAQRRSLDPLPRGPTLVEDSSESIQALFTQNGNQGFVLNTVIGGSWFTVASASNGLPNSDLKVLVMQLTTAGGLSGQLNYQVFPQGLGVTEQRLSVAFDGPGTYGLGNAEVATHAGAQMKTHSITMLTPSTRMGLAFMTSWAAQTTKLATTTTKRRWTMARRSTWTFVGFAVATASPMATAIATATLWPNVWRVWR